MKKKLPLRSFRLKSFKAVRDSSKVKFTPLTAFIGNNGSGKSSLIEGLETFQAIAIDGLDQAMQHWFGLENAWNKAINHDMLRYTEQRPMHRNPMSFEASCVGEDGSFQTLMEINLSPVGSEGIFIQKEHGKTRDWTTTRDAKGVVESITPLGPMAQRWNLSDGESIFRHNEEISSWQFLSLNPASMGSPRPQKRTGGRIKLNKDGSNLAEYLLEIRRINIRAFDGIIETLQYVLPYAKDVQPTLASELERSVYLQLSESDFKVPGWLLSTGTLRILALLAILRHPSPPPVICIEEIENGLDPRSIHLIIDEVQHVAESGLAQIIFTTHSPYLLDLLELPQIILVERNNKGEPTFSRPATKPELQEWSKSFNPGRLYTMSRLGRGDQ